MSCYLPLVHRWKKPEQLSVSSNEPSGRGRVPRGQGGHGEQREQLDRTDCSHVLALRDGKGVTLSQGYGDFPQQVFLNIRHDHPTLGLGDVAYQRLHQEHTLRSDTATARRHQASQAGVVSLGLPLGISSLKLTTRHRRKQKTGNPGPDGDNHGGQIKSDLYEKLSKSSHNLADGASFHNANTHQAERHYHAGRKSSLPRKAKIPSSYQYQPRPLSVDADLLMQSTEKPGVTGAGGAPAPPQEAVISAKFFVPGEDRPSSEDILRFAHLTSPRSFMASQEVDKSSSGNSSGSELTSEEYQHQHQHQHQHPAIRGRAAVNINNILANRGPPPRHLLPAKLRPSPATKLHPYVALPRHVVSGLSGMRSVDLVSPSIT